MLYECTDSEKQIMSQSVFTLPVKTHNSHEGKTSSSSAFCFLLKAENPSGPRSQLLAAGEFALASLSLDCAECWSGWQSATLLDSTDPRSGRWELTEFNWI